MTPYRERHLALEKGGKSAAKVETPAEDSAYICPECGRDFGTEHGLKIHLGKAHEE